MLKEWEKICKIWLIECFENAKEIEGSFEWAKDETPKKKWEGGKKSSCCCVTMPKPSVHDLDILWMSYI
jgi:hypothetical protein